MAEVEKPCVHCGQSCAGQARVRDAKGRYAHQACAEKHQGAARGSRAAPATGDDAGTMAAILSDIDDKDMIGGEHSCQGCGYPMEDDATICLHCGFNRESGRQYGTKVGRDPNKQTKGGKALSVGASAGGMALAPFLPIIGAVIAGAVGAGIWAAIAYVTEYEVGYVASIVGGMCGLGALLGTDGEGNMWSGTIAVAAAIAAIFIGKMVTLNIYMNSDSFKELRDAIVTELDSYDYTLDDVQAEDVQRSWAFDRVELMINENRVIDWPDEDFVDEDLDWASYPTDYPEGVVDEVEARWEALSEDEQLAEREAALAEMRDEVEQARSELTRGMNNQEVASTIYEHLDLFDGLWAVLALMAAWGVGAGMVAND
jgi:hypothetical protein